MISIAKDNRCDAWMPAKTIPMNNRMGGWICLIVVSVWMLGLLWSIK